MIEKKIRTEQDTIYYREFTSIRELVNFLRCNEVTKEFRTCQSSMEVSALRTEFTGTKTYKEAEELLLYGWDYGAEKLNDALKVITKTKSKTKNFYSVQGYQACVPRYLQGMPDSMIQTRRIPQKEKRCIINKMISYSVNATQKTILKESAKALDVVKRLEADGVRTELNILHAVHDRNRKNRTVVMTKICIKKMNERLNVKKISFPLVHPSMLRRILFAYIERAQECNSIGFSIGHGIVVEDKNILKNVIENEYCIPEVLEEDIITDLEQYKI